MTDKKRKPKTQAVTFVKYKEEQGLILYTALDSEGVMVLGGREGFTAPIATKGRSNNAAALWQIWYREIGRITGRSAIEIKAECKLVYGVPIMRAGNPEFKELYDSAIKPLPYEVKIKLMEDIFKVTSLFSKYQGIEYQETLQREFAEMNINLIVL